MSAYDVQEELGRRLMAQNGSGEIDVNAWLITARNIQAQVNAYDDKGNVTVYRLVAHLEKEG